MLSCELLNLIVENNVKVVILKLIVENNIKVVKLKVENLKTKLCAQYVCTYDIVSMVMVIYVHNLATL